MNKKIFTGLFASLLALVLLVGCQTNNDPEPRADGPQTNVDEPQTNEDEPQTNEDDKKTVTTTTSFLYDAVNRIAEDKVENLLVIPHGEDPHLYQAKPEDLNKIENADLVLYHGLHFEANLEQVLEEHGKAVSANFPENELIYVTEDGEEESDPHFWFDIDLYKNAVEFITTELSNLLPEEAEFFKNNQTKYFEEIDAMEVDLGEKIKQIPEGSRYLITPHDAFNYFSKQYGMEVVAPQGLSTDSEVSNADLEETANFIVENKVKAIFTESTTNPQNMQKLQEIVKDKGFSVEVVHGEGQELLSDSLAPVGEKGDNYIDMYTHNVDLIVDNLK